MQKILVIVSVVISLATAALGFLNKTKLDETKHSLEDKTSANSKLSTEKTKLTADLKSANEKNAALSSDAEKTSADLADAKAKAEKATSALTDLQKEISDKEATITQQKTDMAAKDSRIAELESKTGATTQSGGSREKDLQKQLEQATLDKGRLEADNSKLKEELGGLKEKEAQRRAKIMRNGLEGRILAVNPSWNFVVLSLGDRNGVVNNAEMLIKRGSQLIGKVRITSVEPSTSIADIVANSVRSGISVQPGDSVIYSGPGEEALEQKAQ